MSDPGERESPDVQQQLRRAVRHVELSRDLLITAGFDGYFKQVNGAWVEAFGWSESEMTSRPSSSSCIPTTASVRCCRTRK